MHTTPMHTRRSSVYTIRLDGSDYPETTALILQGIRDGIITQTIAVVDHGDTSVSFRAATDEDALDVTGHAVTHAGLPCTIDPAGVSLPVGVSVTTGLGAHRRTVA